MSDDNKRGRPRRAHVHPLVEGADEPHSHPDILPVRPLRQSRALTVTPSIEQFYAGLPAETTDVLRDAAARIHQRRRKQIEDIIAIGRDLRLAKERLGHGQFLMWLHIEVTLSERTAQNYMRVADEFDGKSATVADLPPTVVYKLAAKATPAELRQEIVRQLEHGNRPSPAAIDEQIAEAQRHSREQRDRERKAQRRRKKLATMTPAERTKFDQQEQRRDREERRRLQQVEETQRQRIARADDLLNFLDKRLGDEVAEVLTCIDELGGHFLVARYRERTAMTALVEEVSAVDA
jgi:hypothetical protein